MNWDNLMNAVDESEVPSEILDENVPSRHCAFVKELIDVLMEKDALDQLSAEDLVNICVLYPLAVSAEVWEKLYANRADVRAYLRDYSVARSINGMAINDFCHPKDVEEHQTMELMPR